MEINKVLENLGLKEGEIKVYLDLLKFNQSSVAKIKERTQLHRTTIYDFLDSLMNKGLVSHITISGTKEFRAKEPEKLFQLLDEKKDQLTLIFSELEQLQNQNNVKFSAEVLKGKEGFKFWLNDMIKTNKNVYGFGVDEEMFQSQFKYEVAQYFNKRKKLKYKERLLTKESTNFVFYNEFTTYRYLPDKYFSPTPTIVYGNKTMILIWEPLHIILIDNKGLADSYKNNFELLWKMAKGQSN